MKLDSKTVAQLTLPAGKSDTIYFDGKLPGFGFRLRASNDGRVRKSWIVQYRHAGMSRRLLLGSAEVLSVAQAREQAKEALGKVATGHDPQAEKVARRHKDGDTLKALADEYLMAKESTVRPRSFSELKRYLSGPYFKALHNMPLDRIGRRDVAARVLAIGRECGATTAARARGALSSMFAWAMGEGLAEANPVIGTNAPKEPPPRDRVLSDADLAAVWNACGDDDFGKIVKLLILSGQRRTEVGGMAQSEIKDGQWHIPSARTKNHREHVLPLPRLALEVIESVPERFGRDCLFGERAAAGFTSWAHPKRDLDAKLGDQVRPWTLHDLRRSVATRMCDLGILPHVVEQILNHQSGHRGGIVGVYNKSAYEAPVRAAMALWNDHICSIISGGERKLLAYPQGASRLLEATRGLGYIGDLPPNRNGRSRG
jgi:integrase